MNNTGYTLSYLYFFPQNVNYRHGKLCFLYTSFRCFKYLFYNYIHLVNSLTYLLESSKVVSSSSGYALKFDATKIIIFQPKPHFFLIYLEIGGNGCNSSYLLHPVFT